MKNPFKKKPPVKKAVAKKTAAPASKATAKKKTAPPKAATPKAKPAPKKKTAKTPTPPPRRLVKLTPLDIQTALYISNKLLTQRYINPKTITPDADGLFSLEDFAAVVKGEMSANGLVGTKEEVDKSIIARNNAQAVRQTADAELTMMKQHEWRGDLLPRWLVQRFMGATMSTLRSKILSLPNDIVPRLELGEKSAKELNHEMQRLLREHLDDTSTSLDELPAQVIKEAHSNDKNRKN